MTSDILSWLTLKSVPGIGNYRYKILMDEFTTPEKILDTPWEEIAAIKGISINVAKAIGCWKIPEHCKHELELALQKGFNIVTMNQPDYPELLRQLPDPPPYLYVYGTISNDLDNLSVVGSRNATSYGISAAFNLSKNLAETNLRIVSGMARGIDTAAHKGAICANGKTTAVLGCGLGRIYPPENRHLYHQIAENGAVISEFPVNAPPDPHNFPLRNRVICGISLGTLVVEAAKKSGSLITARLANEQGREVFAVPGSIHSFKSTGTHSLLKQGAKLVENTQDILEELRFLLKDSTTLFPKSSNPESARSTVKLDDQERQVLEILEPYPVHMDILTRKLNMNSGNLSGILLQLELKGLVRQSPGKLFSLSEEKL